jgi:GNAT superfamily N-acetyltransferase
MKTRVMKIRPAHRSDATRLTEIALSAKRHWGYADELIELWADELTISEDLIRTHPVYCATCEGEVVGFYALSKKDGEYELDHIWVDPKYMGGGIGKALFAHAVRTVAAFGGTALVIIADPHAEGFYRKMGAQIIGHVSSRPEGRILPLLRLPIGNSTTNLA